MLSQVIPFALNRSAQNRLWHLTVNWCLKSDRIQGTPAHLARHRDLRTCSSPKMGLSCLRENYCIVHHKGLLVRQTVLRRCCRTSACMVPACVESRLGIARRIKAGSERCKHSQGRTSGIQYRWEQVPPGGMDKLRVSRGVRSLCRHPRTIRPNRRTDHLVWEWMKWT